MLGLLQRGNVPKRIPFLCTGNSCRSQIAEGLWRELAGPGWEAHSAGSKPVGFVHPLAVEVMAERGIVLDDARSKSVDGFLGESLDLVVRQGRSFRVPRHGCPS